MSSRPRRCWPRQPHHPRSQDTYLYLHPTLITDSGLNAFLEGREVAALCIYHDEGCEARQLMDLMRTHRRVLINNAMFENPYFEPPDQHRDRRDS